MLKFLKYSLLLGLFQIPTLQNLSALTDKYRCIIRDEPASTMSIGWNQISGAEPVVYYGTTDFGTSVEKYAQKAFPQRTIHAKGMHNHFARLSGLRPNTVYYFVIQDSEGVSQRYSFRTQTDDHRAKLSIIAGGDSRNHRTARVAANKIVAKLCPDFVLFGGDMTGGDSDREWKEWMDDWQKTIAPNNRITPVVPARGNHEFSNNSIVDMFDVRSTDVYYALTFARGLLRVYTLNSMMPNSGDQKDWLAQDLAANQDVAWRMAQYHHPMRPHTKRKGEHEALRRLWAPLFAQFGVRLAIECDSHVAKVTESIRSSNEPGNEEGFVRDTEKGTFYVGEGGWGAPLREADDAKSWTTGIGSFNQINWIFVDLNKMEVRTIKTDNADMVQSLTEQTRFSMPDGIDIWKFNQSGVLNIENLPNSQFNPREAQNMMELAGLEAFIQNDQIRLNWKAMHEIPNMRFKVQVSTNKLTWRTVGIMHVSPAQADYNKYTITDAIQGKGGKYFYRISVVDGLGNERMKKDIEVRTVGNEKMDLLTASLTSGQLIVDIELPDAVNLSIELFDTQRRRVFVQENRPFRRGKHNIPLNVKHLMEGFYLMEISYNEQLIRKNVKITKPNLPEN